ncbi:MAG: hypothetical protein KJ597_03030, partial [Nanoarchaeota archaeon]|nr:hypothetical protein [Nanoarchaeota archaeon]
MDSKKRGVLVVLVLVLFIFNSLSVLSFTKYEDVEWYGDCDDPVEEECNAILKLTSYISSFNNYEGRGACGQKDGKELPKSFPSSIANGNTGCYLQIVEEEVSEDCGWAALKIGSVVGYTMIRALRLKNWLADSDNDDDDDARDLIDKKSFMIRGGSYANDELICDTDERWTRCSPGFHGEAVSWESEKVTTTFVCLPNIVGANIWMNIEDIDETVDRDEDGDPDYSDCAPDDGRVHGGFACAMDYNVLTDSEVEAEVEYEECDTVADCDQFPYEAKCDEDKSWCQYNFCLSNPADEICGDGIDNDCSEDLEGDAVYDLGDDDDCDLEEYKHSCENFCLSDDNHCSWIETNKENNCCGDDGLEDLGELEEGFDEDAGNYVCFNKELVGREETEFPESVWPNEPGPLGEDNRCSGQWCWVNALGDAKFNIYTINNYFSPPYDIVSNGAEWYQCQAEGPLPKLELPPDPDSDITEIKKNANRFYCYQEGNHWSWAECAGTPDVERGRINPGIKGRYGGEGLYTLPLKVGDEIQPEITDPEIYLDSRKYEDFYGDNYLFDFSGYDYFNFMVKFPGEINPPVDVRLEMYGRDGEELYFDKDVLSYTTNNPFFTDNFMHVQVPIPSDLQGVGFIKLKAEPTAMDMTVRNVYLSKESQDQLCSGQDAIEESSWLTDMDQADPRKEIDGEQLCTELFGLEAWLGDDEEVDLPEASCCGNTKSEYYAGSSDPLGENETNYGCWNSQPLADGERIMNVEYEVEYVNQEIVLDYPEEPFDVTLTMQSEATEASDTNGDSGPTYSCPEFVCGAEVAVGGCSQVFNDGCTGVTKTGPGETCTVSYEFCSVFGGCTLENKPFICEDTVYQINEISLEEETLYENKIINFNNPPLLIDELKLNKNDFASLTCTEGYSPCPGEEELVTSGYVRVVSNNPNVDVYLTTFYDLSNQLEEVTYQDFFQDKTTFYIMAELNENYQPIKTFNHENPTNTYTHSCNQDECLFPLPGEPPYTVTNLHPDLYDLYFVTEEGELPINQEATTDLSANIKAKRVAQQIIYNYPEDDDPQFYGCQAPAYLEEATDYLVNQPYCSYKSGKFCAFSTQHQEESGEIFPTINSWSDEPLTMVGYESVELTTESMEDFYNRIELNLKPYTENQDRNFTSIALPTRNIISNAEFKPKGSKEVPHWEFEISARDEEDALEQVDRGYKVILNQDEILRSERIAIPQNETLHFSANLSCQNTKITLSDKDGTATEPESFTNIFTDNNTALSIEFTGPCQIYQPLLQLLDDLGPVNYYKKPYQQAAEDDPRAGIACCPQDFCWNGYACVEPMTDLAYLVEHIKSGRDYRCVQGIWKYQPVKFDWNFDQWGFCSTEEQCFVSPDGSSENTVQTFYEGQIPNCIENKEYLFDHYCDQGNWSS